jgi:hypothetical protein
MRRMRLKGFLAVSMLLLLAAPAFAYTNPANLTAGQYTPIAVSSTPVSIASGLPFPVIARRVEIQNLCSCAITIQLHGASAIFGVSGYVLEPGQTKAWHDEDGPVPQGPYSFVTQGGMSCPDITCTPDAAEGVNILQTGW